MKPATARARRADAPPRPLDLGPARDDALLDAAAIEFNAYGVAGASLSRIARAVGLTRAALYYYFDSREDLAYRCYLRACTQMAADLAAAAQSGRTGLARVQRFIELTLDPHRAPGVVPSEIPCLGDAHRERVEAAHGRNVATLVGFIERGAADRSIRACDAEVAAQAILGMVYWVPLAEEWVAGSGETVRRRAAEALADLVTNGVAADPDYPFTCPLDAAMFGFRPRNAFDREQAAALKVEQLTRTASRLFNRRGIDGTSLDQITQALGATKGAFFHYLDDKTQLVAECHRRSMELYEKIADAAERLGRNGLERGLLGLHLNVQAQAGDLAPLSALTGLEALPQKLRAPLQKRGLALQKRYEEINRKGLADGSVRRFDLRTVSSTGAGVFGWIPKWRRDDDPRSPHALADEIVALYLRGLRRR